MEKFVTDLDKLLDDFESSSENVHSELYDSSGFHSLKINSEQHNVNIDTQLHATFSTLYDSNIMHDQINQSTNEPTQLVIDNTIQSITNTSDYQSRSINGVSQHDKRRTVSDVSTDNFTGEIHISSSPNHSQVPPRKKSRPNSLFGLSSLVTLESSEDIQPVIDLNDKYVTDTQESPCSYKNKSLSLDLKESVAPTIIMTDSLTEDFFHKDQTVPSIVFEAVSPPIIEDKASENSLPIDQLELIGRVMNEVNVWQGIPVDELGQKEPSWISDETSDNCMQCDMPFTMFRRRHHCRACGRLLCNKCCCWRMQLRFSSKLFPKDRVCAICFQYLIRVEASKKQCQNIKSSTFQPLNSVLKSNRPTSLAISPNSLSSSQQSMPNTLDAIVSLKSVIFADGIRPGGDLTEFESSRIITPTKFQTSSKIKRLELNVQECSSREPPLFEELDMVGMFYQNKQVFIPQDGSETTESAMIMPTSPVENNCKLFAITKNLYIQFKIIKLAYCTCSIKDQVYSNSNQQDCDCDPVECWYFASIGLETIGVEEIVILLKKLPEELKPPIEILKYYFQIYQKAFKNETKLDNMEMTVEIFSDNNQTFKEWAGILHIRPTFQCLNKIPTPRSPFLIGILIHRWEFPWAMLLPLRLILALGNQLRFYPCSIISNRDRPPVYGEVGQTILQIVCPIFAFPNNLERGLFDTSIVPNVPGMWLHLLASQETIVQIPKHSYSYLLDILSCRQSEHNPLAFAASFSREADSHLVCCQNEETGQYFSSAISIQNTERMITASTMILFVPCKDNEEHGTSIVEDAIVVKLSLMQLDCVVNSLKTMSDLVLQCGTFGAGLTKKSGSNATLGKSIIKIVWTDNSQMSDMASVERPSLVSDETIQSALNSLRNGGDKILKSCRVPSSLQIISPSLKDSQSSETNFKLVWTRFHMVETGNSFTDSTYEDPIDLEGIIHEIADNFGQSISPFLQLLYDLKIVNIGVRTMIGRDNVHWMAASSRTHQYSSSPPQSPIKNISPLQSPACETDSQNNFSASFKIKSDSKIKFYNVEELPEVCVDSLNEIFVPFLYSKTTFLLNASLISELEFHIIN